jgi:hypothetical protein
MMDISIGIMQGRLLPERLDRLQVFPISNWKQELIEARRLGFDSFELLYDKGMVLSGLLQSEENHSSLGLGQHQDSSSIKSKSVCLDFLAEIQLTAKSSTALFLDELQCAMTCFRNSSIETLIIPCCDKNEVESAQDLDCVLSVLERSGIDELAGNLGLRLSLELTLPADIIVLGFSLHSFNNIGVCLDVGNIRSAGLQPELEIGVLGKLINHVHIKDRPVGGTNMMLGDGDVDFRACLKALGEIGYSGDYILETRYFTHPLNEAICNLNFLKNMVD